jgi:hypothetical protein
VIAAEPFTALGLDPRADLTDDDVRSAWRRVAAATHPDRGDGGDPARFASAAAAYTELRTTFGRREAAAAAMQASGASAGERSSWPAGLAALLRTAGSKVSVAGLARLGLRILVAAAVAVLVLLAAGPGPAGPALVTGIGTWLILTARRDLR